MPTVQSKQGSKAEKEDKTVRYDKTLMGPGKYEVTKDSTFTVEIPLRVGEDKWWGVCVKSEAQVTEKVVFRMWTYDEMIEMRKMATKYDPIRRVHMIDHDVLNRLKFQKLMVSWTFGKDNPRLNVYHVNGVLTDESWEAMTKLQTNILRFIVERMNERYESIC